VNGDGVSDILIGAMWADGSSNGDSQTGEVYVLFGKPSGQSFSSPIQLSASYFDGSNGFIVYGIDVGDYAGESITSAGDVNGDGVSDILIGANAGDGSSNSASNTGEAYVLFGFNSFSATTSAAPESQVELAHPVERIFQPHDHLRGSCEIFAAVLSRLRPVHAQSLDRFQLQKRWVYRGGHEHLRCFNSTGALGKAVCYNVSAHDQCSNTFV